ncbi:hypothetical protein [Paenibacillus terreus]|uniref:hypothetical protein n=1 Tax=Paenibacillus terreus TaxID=1387834 RepID=UPI0035CCEE6A
MGHDEVCLNCGFCKDCEKYRNEVNGYEAMIRDPDYFFEPWDGWDTPESHVPRRPVERYKVFPSGSHKIVRISEPEIETLHNDKNGKYNVINIKIVIRSDVRTPIGVEHSLVGTDSFEVPFSWVYLPEEKRIRPGWLDPYFNEFWKHLEKCYTKKALDELLEDLLQNHVQPVLNDLPAR